MNPQLELLSLNPDVRNVLPFANTGKARMIAA